LIDAGVETAHPLLRHASITAWGCGGRKVASAHGTAVASLLVGRGEHFRSAAPGAALYAADVYCDDPIGRLHRGGGRGRLAWLIGEQVPVVNISLVGPANRALELVVRRAAARGVLLVAAVGNDGPAAPPLYPAAYPDVVRPSPPSTRAAVSCPRRAAGRTWPSPRPVRTWRPPEWATGRTRHRAALPSPHRSWRAARRVAARPAMPRRRAWPWRHWSARPRTPAHRTRRRVRPRHRGARAAPPIPPVSCGRKNL
jgi:hypothetical protein